MGAAKLKIATALWLALSLAVAGAGVLAHQGLSANPLHEQQDDSTQVQAAPLPQPDLAAPKAPRADRFGDPLPDGAIARMGTMRFRHGLLVTGVAFAANGQTLASAGYDNTVRLWEAATGKEVRRFEGHKGCVESLAISPDSKLLATGSGDRTVRLWELATGKEIRRLAGHQPREGPDKQFPLAIPAVAFSPDGRLLASGGYDKTVRLWEAATGKELWRATGRGYVHTLAFAPDGKTLASASMNEIVVHLWDVRNGKERGQVGGQPSGIKCLAFSPDGKTLAVGNYMNEAGVRLWDVSTGKEVRRLQTQPVGGFMGSVAFARDGKTLASGALGDGIRLWETATGKELHHLTMPGTPGWIGGVAFSPDGKTLAVGTRRRVRLWQVATGKELLRPDGGHERGIQTVALSPDGNLLASAGQDGPILFWEAATGKEFRRLAGHANGVQAVAFSPDGTVLASCGQDRTVRLWEMATGQELRQLVGHNFLMAALAFSPDGKTLASASYSNQDRAIRLWEVATGKELRRFEGHSQRLECVAFSPDGRYLASGSYHNDCAIRLWEASTGREVRRFAGHQHGVRCVAFSPDGRTLVSGSYDNTVRLWEVATGQERRRFEAAIASVAFAPAGRFLAAGGDRAVRLWDLGTAKELGPLQGHQGSVSAVAFAADGKTLASGSDDTTALVWDMTRFLKTGRMQEGELRPEQVKTLWADLGRNDARRAYQAIWTLVLAPTQAVPFVRGRLHERLPLASAADTKRIARLIADLDDDTFIVREEATQELEKLGELAEPALRMALTGAPSLEVRRRVEQLLARFDEVRPSAERLQALRAIEVLEHIGTAAARQALGALSKAAPGTWLAQQARAAVGRLDKASPAVSPQPEHLGWKPHAIKKGDGKGGWTERPGALRYLHRDSGKYVFPFGIARMDNGEVLLLASWHDGKVERPVTCFSKDKGKTWSAFEVIPAIKGGPGVADARPMMLTDLGRGRLMFQTASKWRHFSADHGHTWKKTIANPPAKGGVPWNVEGNALVDYDEKGVAKRIAEIGYAYVPGKKWNVDEATVALRWSSDGGKAWQDETRPPQWKYTAEHAGRKYPRGVSEGALVRAANGWLVAALRTDMPPRYLGGPNNDSLEGTGVSISKDDGKTWSPLNILFDAGRHHAHLLRMPNGDLIMILIVRVDVHNGKLASYRRGLEAVVSRDNGQSWDVARRYVLDGYEFFDGKQWFNGECGHLSATMMEDGTILCCYANYLTKGVTLIRWNPDDALRK